MPEYIVTATDTRAMLVAVLGEAQAARWGRIVDGAGIQTRHIVAPLETLLRRWALGDRIVDYREHAIALGGAAASHALTQASVDPAAVRAIISVSCTGYMLPSLDAYLVARLGIRPDARRLPITELGCSAGVAAVAFGADLLAAVDGGPVLLVSVEPCSLCLRLSEPAPDDVLGSILFGDGAAAAVLSSAESGPGPTILGHASMLWPESLDQLGMRLASDGFRFLLSPLLPGLVRRCLRPTVNAFLSRHGVCVADIGFWVVHPGGPKILDAAAEALDLPDTALGPAWSVWERYGNVSSATVFFILRQIQERTPPPEGSLGLMLAFGPGVTCEMALLRAGDAGYSFRTASASSICVER